MTSAVMSREVLSTLCQKAFRSEALHDDGAPQHGAGHLDLPRFRLALLRVFGHVGVPLPDHVWFEKVFSTYSPKCGGHFVTFKAFEDIAFQYYSHQARKGRVVSRASGRSNGDGSSAETIGDGTRTHAGGVSEPTSPTLRSPMPAFVPPASPQLQQRSPSQPQRMPVRPPEAKLLLPPSAVRAPTPTGASPTSAGMAMRKPGFSPCPRTQAAQVAQLGATPAAASSASRPSAVVAPASESSASATSPTAATSPAARGAANLGSIEIASQVMFPVNRGRMAIYEHYAFDAGVLGEGAFGQVFMVTHRTTGQRRACKCVGVEDEKEGDLVKNEIEVMKRLDHPNILRLSECFVDGRNIHLISELCEGGTLLEGFASRGSASAAASCLWQILAATAYCHGRGIIHRDLKPSNALYVSKSPESPVKVIDFGLAGFLEKLQEKAGSKPMRRAGTIYFMAPEMLAERASYTEKVDLWAIGCILFLLLTGAHPFWPGGRTSFSELRAKVATGAILEHANWLAAPAPVRDLVQRLLALDPTRRISAVEALRHPWLKDANAPGKAPSGSQGEYQADPCVSMSVFEGLGRYQASSKLRKAVLKLLAKEVDEARIQKLREQFRALDEGGHGIVSQQVLLEGIQRHLPYLTHADLALLLPSGSSEQMISCTDFVAALLAPRGFSRAELLNAFRRFDVRKEGRISLSALAEVLRDTGPADRLEQIFREADVGQDGGIDFEEFCSLIQN